MSQPPTDDTLSWNGSVPRSERFGDVYYSTTDGLQESRHVFLHGNDLVERLTKLADTPGTCFTVGETGFGTGLNVLALWQLWQRIGHRQARLDILSVEAWPLPPQTLSLAHAAWPELAELSARLTALLPPPIPGTHRLVLEPGRVTLTLLYGDAATRLQQHDACVDAWFLDGFAPAKNPDMWSPQVFSALARLSKPGTTLATFTSAGAVRRGLQDAGFTVSKQRGFGRKRDMSVARFDAPRSAPEGTAPWFHRPSPLPAGRALVIGGGLAGCAAARALAERGWQVDLFERGPRLASEASGNPAGMTYLRPSTRDTAQNRYYRSSWLFAIQRIRDVMEAAGGVDGIDFSLEGIVSLPGTEQSLQDAKAFTGWPGGDRLLEACSPDALQQLCRHLHPAGQGFLLKGAGWVHPPSLCAALTAHEGIHVHTGVCIDSLEPAADGCWLASGASVSEPGTLVVIANSLAARHLTATGFLTQTPVRGQITLVPASAATAGLRHVINHETYVTPARDQLHCVGATFQPGCDDLTPRHEDDVTNLEGLRRALPGWPDIPPAGLSSRVGVRSGAPDYLPYVGPLPDLAAFERDYAMRLRKGQLRGDFPAPAWQSGLFCSLAHGSRGITSALLAAEILGAYADGGGMPVDREVLHAVHPARHLIRAWRRREA